ncbi:hypothetical protein OAP71_03610 [Pelagibacteraceae bacterium]|nr:hypothetical protein [Pelagibacteraceae bacterium]
MLKFNMKKILLISLMFLFQTNLIAGLEGHGKIKLSPYSVEQFEKYLSSKNHNKTLGANDKHGIGTVFSISADGLYSGYYYCFQGNSCTKNEAKVKNYCQTRAKKSTGKKIKCNTFAIKRKIVWNNLNRVVPKDVNVKEFLEELNMVSNSKPPSDLDGEQRKQLKSLLDMGIMTQKEYDVAIKKIK